MNTDKLESGRTKMAKRFRPPLAPGNYTLTVQQELSGNIKLEKGKIKTESFSFSSEADAFVLNQEDIYSVYPPDGSYGLFHTVIPHIVLRRRTLPWERKMAVNDSPWLALLLFKESEGVNLISLDAGEAFLTAADTYCPVNPKQIAGGAKYQVLDVPAGLFCQVCPPAEDLPFLAHVRCVSRDDKATENIFTEDWLSVVTANRLPRMGGGEKGLKNTVFLVSLEDFTDFLTNEELFHQIESEKTYKKVRIPVLASWSFYAKEEPFNFIASFEKLDADALRIKARGDSELTALLDRGYTAHNHQLRDGGKTVSFYHGPFRPCTAKEVKPYFQLFPDARFIYQPELGMFDASYSTASNLGRMMGLKDQTFSKALLRFRNLVQVQTWERYHVQSYMPAAFGIRAEFNNMANGSSILDRLDMIVKDLIEQKSSKALTTITLAEDERIQRPDLLKPDNRQSHDFPPEITGFLARLSLLYEIPFCYLVPDPQLLPEDSIRFFHLDHHWLSALLDGALSLGRCFDADYQQEVVWTEQLLEEVYVKRSQIRSVLQRKPGEEVKQYAANCLQSIQRNTNSFVSTGFLLHSDLVSGWKGLEFVAYEKEGDKEPLPFLRLEAVGKKILLGIVAGDCGYIEIRQPPEGLHFGTEYAKSGRLVKRLRTIDEGKLYEDEAHIAEVTLRSEPLGVINYHQTGAAIAGILGVKEADSVLLSLQMIQNPATGIIKS